MKRETDARPPRAFEALVRHAVSRLTIGDSVLTDLRDEFRSVAMERGRVWAVVWYAWTSAMLAARMRLHDPESHRSDRPGHHVANATNERRGRSATMGGILRDLRYAVRGLRRAPGFTVLAALTFALGVGATTAIWVAVDGILLSPLPYSGSESLYTIEVNTGGEGWYGSSVPEYFDFATDLDAFEAVAGYDTREITVGDTLSPERVRAVLATASLLPMLGVRPEMGSFFTQEDAVSNARVVMLSHALWAGAYGSRSDIVGSDISLFGQSWQVVGVMPASFRFPDRDSRLWFPWGLTPESDARNNHYVKVVGRLRPGLSSEVAREQLNALVTRSRDAYPAIYSERGYRTRLRSLHESVTADVRSPLLVLMVAVVLVLLIACVNVANLFLARGEARKRELATRSALGASRGQIVRQLLTESLMLAAGAGILGLVLARGLIRLLVLAAPDSIPRLDDVAFDPASVGLVLGLVALAGVVFGTVPALAVTKRTATLARGGRGALSNRTSRRMRRTLVASQIAFAAILAIATGVMMETMHNLRAIDPGFRADHVLTFAVSPAGARYPSPERRIAFWNEMLERMRAIPGVQAAGATTALPLTGGYSNLSLRVEGRVTTSIGDAPDGRVQWVTPGFLEAAGLRLTRGRFFDDTDRDGARPVVVVSESFVREFWPGLEPIGRTMKVFADDYPMMEVIGVVADIRHDRLDGADAPMWYVPTAQSAETAYQTPLQMYVFLRTAGDPNTVLDAARAAARAVDATAPISRVQPLGDVVESSVSSRTFTLDLLRAFGLVALLLACVGVYGVTTLAVRERTGEIALRKALGAGPASIVRLVASDSFVTFGGGALIGTIAGLAAARLMRGLLFGVGTFDPRVFAGTLGALLLVAGVATALPAARALRLEALASLRNEI